MSETDEKKGTFSRKVRPKVPFYQKSSLQRLWSARSVAVVGATERPGSLGRLPIEYLQRFGFEGAILPINPRAERVLGLDCYPTLTAAPGPIDLALVLVAAETTLSVVDDCAAAGVPVAIVGTSGFAEAGNAELQNELVRRARRGNVRIVGPNCIGAVGSENNQVVSFSPLFGAPHVPMRGGALGFVTQSGALGYGAVSLAYERGLGLGWIVNTGNEADVTAVEVLRELAGLDECRGLLAYVETMTDGDGWRQLAELGTPIAVLKAGTSEAGAIAATSHTGALAGSDRVVDDVLRQLGIARARDVGELLDIGAAFITTRRPAGGRVAVVTTSGGSGILAADAVADTDLDLAALSAATTEALSDIVPAFGSIANPVDVTATVMSDRTLFDRCLHLVAADPGVDAVVACFCVLTGADVDIVVASLAQLAANGKPVVVARTGAEFLAPTARSALHEAGVACYITPEQAVRALAALTRIATSRDRLPSGAGSRTQPPMATPLAGSEVDLKSALHRMGVPVPPGRVVTDAADAAVAVREVGGRAVAKAVVPGLFHKSEAGGVRLDVTPESAATAFARLAALGGKVYVEEMVEAGAEVLVGVAPTPLGQVITLATGGVLTEVIDDAVFRLLPIDMSDAHAMIAQFRGAAVLRGTRGRPALDVDALARLLVQVSDLPGARSPGYELDLNPVAVLTRGVVVLDAAIATPR